MDEEKRNTKSEKPQNAIVYALADYKQLVIQYRTKYADSVKAVVFWKTTAIWIAAVALVCSVTAALSYRDNRRQAAAATNSLNALSGRIQVLSDRFDGREQEFAAVKAELETKSAQIRQLEKSLSTVSKKQVEKLLTDAEPK